MNTYTTTRHLSLADALSRIRAHKNWMLVTPYLVLCSRGMTDKSARQLIEREDGLGAYRAMVMAASPR